MIFPAGAGTTAPGKEQSMSSIQNTQQTQQTQQPQQTQEAGQKAGETRVADEKSVESFSKAMKKDKASGKEGKVRPQGLAGEGEKSLAAQSSLFSLSARSKKDTGEREGRGAFGDDGPSGRLPRGEDILAQMGAVRPQSEAVVAGAAPQAAEAATRVDGDLTSKLVDRILVSAADGKQNAEVRLQLKDDILPGTEIRITRTNDGAVSVQFVTNDIRAEQMLGNRQLADLQNVLAQNLQVEVRVSTVKTDGSMTSDSGAGGQQGQQGRQGGQDQQRDGRSSQHDLFEGLGDEA